MNEVKYVIMDSPVEGEFPILFPLGVKHSFIVECIQGKYPGIECVSAGFIDEDLKCYGKSQSLKIVSREIDDIIMSSAFPFWSVDE
jgi:hypothetical protein